MKKTSNENTDSNELNKDDIEDILEAGATGVRAKGKKRKKVKNIKLTVIILASSLLLASLLGIYFFKHIVPNIVDSEVSRQTATSDKNLATLIEDIPEELPTDDSLGKGVVEHILKAGLSVQEAYSLRPPTVTLDENNMSSFVKISSCKVDSGGTIRIETSSQGIPASDDKFYYLFAMDSFAPDSCEGLEFLGKTYKNDISSMTCSLLANTADTRLFKKFGIAVKLNGEYKLVSTPSFITNPEDISAHPNVFMNVSSKKGLLIDYNRVFSGQLEDLGVKQAAINIPVSSILGPTTNALFPSVHYTYNGKTYTFNGVILAGFDSTVSTLTAKGIQTTAILLNDYSGAYISKIHPDSRTPGVCPYYMFNGTDRDGVDILSAIGSFLADRYSGNKHGRISNWVIANEINARKEWNYMKYTDVDTYSREYAKGFRILYNAIKSTSGSARVMISLDQTWDRNINNSPDYDGKDVLDSFNSYITRYGNIDWSLAYHPYNVPLTSCKTWASSKYVTHNVGTPMMSMQNIEVLINYMNQPAFLSPSGQCRSIMITELGYTSSAGEQLQAAALAYAYYKIKNYSDIDGLLLNRQTDDATEIAQGLATGITTAGGSHKASYDVFKYMDTSSWESHTSFAKSIIGISNWNEIMR